MPTLTPTGEVIQDSRVTMFTKQEPIEKFPRTIEKPYEEPKVPLIQHEKPPQTIRNDMPLIKKVFYYTLIAFLFIMLIISGVSAIWFNSNFSKLKDKDFSQDIPVNVYSNDTNNNEFNNNVSNSYQHDITNNNTIQNIFNLTTNLEIPQEVIEDMINDIIEGVVDDIDYFNFTNDDGYIECEDCLNCTSDNDDCTNCTDCTWHND